MRVLIACECSGVVRDAFRARGHDAWSCDLLPSVDSRYHMQGDVRTVLSPLWDLLIAHPPCDYLTNSAAWAFNDADYTRYPGVGYHQRVKPGTLTGLARRRERENAVAFFIALYNAPIARKAIENPTGYMNTYLPHKPQTIQPYNFGEDASKGTCLWLTGLPNLTATSYFPPRVVMWQGKQVKRWSNQCDSGQNRLSPSDDRASVRAITYTGIAQAMVQQWG